MAVDRTNMSENNLFDGISEAELMKKIGNKQAAETLKTSMIKMDIFSIKTDAIPIHSLGSPGK